MAIYAQIDQTLKDEATRARVHVALLKWAVAHLQGSQFNAGSAHRDALAQNLLRTGGNDSFYVRTLIQAMLVLPTFDPVALQDTTAGDTALQAQVDTLVPALLNRHVIVVGPPDQNV